MERKILIELDCFRDHTNVYSNYFYLIWYVSKYTEVLSKTVQSEINPCSIRAQSIISVPYHSRCFRKLISDGDDLIMINPSPRGWVV